MNLNYNNTIFSEMAAHNIDVAPVLEAVAKDLVKLFGPLASIHAKEILQNFIKDQNMESAAIWHKISQILLSLDDDYEKLIH